MVSMGKGRPRSVEKGVLGPTSTVLKSGSLNIPPGPVYYPTEEEFKDPLEFIYKIRPEAEQYGICRIVPPKSWKPPFALDLDSFTFPTKTQAIHQLQARPAACDSKTFELEYNRFLENHGGKRSKKRVIFEGEELDLCKLFNAAKRFGGYDKVVKEKKWGEVFRFVKLGKKISECAKHVLCQLYREHLYDYETYYNSLNHETAKSCQGGTHVDNKSDQRFEVLGSKRRRKNQDNEKVKVIKVEKEEELDQICEQCRSGQHGEVMLLCDRCNKGWHIYCLSPPLKQIPPGNWYCLECLNSDKDSFGFVPGKRFSLESFRRMADRAKRKWFGSASASRVQIEKKFWEIVEGLLGEVEVKYGSDLDASVYGSGFPRLNDQRPQSIEAGEWDEYCASPWNLNNLPKLPGSVLQAVHHSIAGVMVPWVYIGMLFSSFCWHFEDHCFYSMNYLHWGEPKCWYSVPGSKASAFEKVMRNSLPDLFDAQPDLLFQLVTMLNPSVLQDNGVPVFSVLQEPGNFVITFPRSYHGGFNFGLNCAEAVNFAPADWLPHGGFGAELYQLYRKVAVLSHEELLCVVAKSNCDSKISPYLKKELLRIYAKEKTWRERLWRNGIVNSSPMSPRKHPEYVGPEEDPTCIICQQYLYLSAVVCRCRPSAFVCLEHWKHLCECKPSKHRLLYRYTLADLNLLVLMTDKNDFQETRQNKNFGRKLSCSDDLSSVTKKVKGGHVSLPQLAEEWLLRTCKIFETPYSSEVYVKALKEAEQFLWAGSEMDPVRDVAKNLSEGEKWAESVRSCLSRVQKWSSHHCNDLEKVSFEHVDRLLNLDPVPCNEPGHLKLKDYAEEARVLIREIDSALSKCSKLSISELEILYFRAADLPIYVKEIEKLGQKISSVKVWVDSVRECVSEKCPAAIDVDLLYKLKSESVELQVQLPEAAMLFDLLMRAESCRSRCNDILTGSITLKNVGVLLQEFDSFTVNIFELKLLRQYHSDAISWLSRFKDVLVNIHEREDQEIVVVELNCILKDGASLKIQVDEFSLLEVEVKKACLRGKALKARATKMPMDFIQQLVKEAVILQIDGEKLFVDISRALAAALRWEERARHILASEAPMSDFEDAIRDSENTCAVLPLLDDVKNAVSVAKSWLKNCKPILDNYFSEEPAASRPLLEIQALKELSSQLGLLKISMEERLMLQTVVNSCKEWEHVACSALQDVDSLFNMDAIGTRITSCIILKIGSLVTRVESITKAGLSLGFDFPEIKKLQEAGSSLHWCNKALSFCSVVPPLEDIQSLIEVSDQFPVSWASGVLCSSLINGVKWIKRASEIIPVSCNHTKFELSAAEKILGEYQRIDVSFPAIVDQLVNAIEKHKSWRDQVHMFFSLKPGERSWSQLVHIKELGMADAFKCCELDRVFSEVEKVEKWKRHCDDIVGSSVADANPLLGALLMIKRTLDNSLCIYDMSRGCKAGDLCLGCFHDLEDREFLTCSTCKDCYHFQCLGPILADVILYTCPYCKFMESGSVSWKGCNSLRFGGRCPELKMLLDLLSESESLFVWTEEREVLQEVVERALACKAFITKIVDYSLAYFDRDLTIISKKLTNALKAVDVSGVHDRESNVNLDLALARNAWRFRTNKLLEGSKKPLIQQIQRYSKEGLAIGIPREDHYWKKLTELKQIGLEWADIAKKVSMDSGALELDKVFKLITEGENLPVHFDKELKLLRDRSMLYCICRKPYDQRDMIACDQCDEWYHFDCIKLSLPPKIYICPACKPESEYGLSMSPVANQESAKFGEPQTPSPRNTEPRREAKEVKLRSLKHLTQSSISRPSSGMDTLLWSNRKPFRRLSKKRVELESLSPFFNIQEQT